MVNICIYYTLVVFALVLCDYRYVHAACCSDQQQVYICGLAVNPIMGGDNWTVRWAVYCRTRHGLVYNPHDHTCYELDNPLTFTIEYYWDNGEHDIFRGIVNTCWHITRRVCVIGPSYEENEGVCWAADPIRLPVNISLYNYCHVSDCDSA